MSGDRVIVVGGGIGGLVAALELAGRGLEVTLFEAASGPGGKMREVRVGDLPQDAGPTVFTMRWVFDSLFADMGALLTDYVSMRPAEILARHAWSERERLDLHADFERSVDAIGEFAGASEARRYRDFSAAAERIYRTLEQPFICASMPGPLSLVRAAGWRGLGDLWQIKPFARLWDELGKYFHDPRLRQLFARYSTYCGSSPFQAPATLMLIAQVEQQGVWLIDGGMQRLADALARLGAERGVEFHYCAEVDEICCSRGRADGIRLSSGERFDADALVFNADPAALTCGHFGRRAARAVAPIARSSRSLSALTWNLLAETEGFPLARHNVFFSADYAAEFDDIDRRQRLPRSPTVYVCAQDRGGLQAQQSPRAERLMCLVNAPPSADLETIDEDELRRCERQAFSLLERCGLQIARRPEATRLTAPAEFARLFPATGGALYGQASHGWRASFSRPGSRSELPGLYLAGGGVHPGPGVPMAALSGRLAAASLMSDLASNARSGRIALGGVLSTR